MGLEFWFWVLVVYGGYWGLSLLIRRLNDDYIERCEGSRLMARWWRW